VAMKTTGPALLEFNPELNRLSKNKELRDGLSVVVQIGDTLWVTNDETISLERLSRQRRNREDTHNYGEHMQFALGDFLRLPEPRPTDPKNREQIEEADVEGLDYDRRDGYLWLVGSHSLKRKKPDDKEESVKENFERLAKVSSDGNRFLLARIPVMLVQRFLSISTHFSSKRTWPVINSAPAHSPRDALPTYR